MAREVAIYTRRPRDTKDLVVFYYLISFCPRTRMIEGNTGKRLLYTRRPRDTKDRLDLIGKSYVHGSASL